MPADRWTRAREITARADKYWADGAILRELHQPPDDWRTFPDRLRLAGPGRDDLSNGYEAAEDWASAITADANRRGWRLETKRISGGILGAQIIPAAAYFDTPQDALALLSRDRHESARRFELLLDRTRHDAQLPAIVRDAAVAVGLRMPHIVLDAAAEWPTLLHVAAWLHANPASGIPARQVPVPGINTKLIEQHTKLLRALLDTADPTLADPTQALFAARYGLATPDRLLRLRAPGVLVGLPHLQDAEVYWPVAGVAGSAALVTAIRQVVIVENVVTFQAIPLRADRLVLWGVGKEAASLLAPISWLHDRQVDAVYWGDIDTHGFHILSTARAVVPHLRSILMDVPTLLAHKTWWATERAPYTGDLPYLTSTETAAVIALRDGTYGQQLRCEQEYIALDSTFTVALEQQ